MRSAGWLFPGVQVSRFSDTRPPSDRGSGGFPAVLLGHDRREPSDGKGPEPGWKAKAPPPGSRATGDAPGARRGPPEPAGTPPVAPRRAHQGSRLCWRGLAQGGGLAARFCSSPGSRRRAARARPLGLRLLGPRLRGHTLSPSLRRLAVRLAGRRNLSRNPRAARIARRAVGPRAPEGRKAARRSGPRPEVGKGGRGPDVGCTPATVAARPAARAAHFRRSSPAWSESDSHAEAPSGAPSTA